jgi:hypothetical protein
VSDPSHLFAPKIHLFSHILCVFSLFSGAHLAQMCTHFFLFSSLPDTPPPPPPLRIPSHPGEQLIGLEAPSIINPIPKP